MVSGDTNKLITIVGAYIENLKEKDKTPSAIRAMPPLLGEHSLDILSEAGYSAKEIEDLFAQKVSQMSV